MSCYYNDSFTDKETEVKKGWLACPSTQPVSVTERGKTQAF